MRAPAIVAALMIGITSVTATASAQVICSAPHSAPSLSTSGSITTLHPGNGWVLATVHRVRSDQFYAWDGSVHPLFGNSRATTRSAFFTGALGLTWGVELWAQVPVHALSFDDPTGTRRRTALGDPRISVRLGSEIFTDDIWPVSVRLGVKLPGSEFPVDGAVLPLSEGQTDYEVAVESGWSLGDLPLYALGWIGYRWRTEGASSQRKPGNELYGHLAVGGILSIARLEMSLDVLDGEAPARSGLQFPSSARRLLQLNPNIGLSVGAGSLEVGAQIPLTGRNLPTGPGVSLGYLLPWGTL